MINFDLDAPKKRKIINIILLIFLFVACTYLFYCMVNRVMTSDFPDHIDESLAGQSYSLMELLMSACCKITKTRNSVAFLSSFLIICTVLVCSAFIKRIVRIIGVDKDANDYIIVSISTLFVCKLCLPDLSPYLHINSIVSQPWHSSTYILMRLLALAAIGLFFAIQKHYINNISIKEMVVFSISIFLVNFAKPNFIIGFAPIMLISLIYDFFKTKFKSAKNAFLFGVCILFGCLILFFQYTVLYPSNGNTTVSISLFNGINFLGNDKKFFFNIPFNLLFPLGVSYYFFKNIKFFDSYSKRVFIQTWGMFILSVLEYIFIKEVGFRETHQNFRWGQEFFSFLLFIISLCFLTKMKKEKHLTEKQCTTLYNIYWLHIIFGITYFVLVCLLHYNYLEI